MLSHIESVTFTSLSLKWPVFCDESDGRVCVRNTDFLFAFNSRPNHSTVSLRFGDIRTWQQISANWHFPAMCHWRQIGLWAPASYRRTHRCKRTMRGRNKGRRWCWVLTGRKAYTRVREARAFRGRKAKTTGRAEWLVTYHHDDVLVQEMLSCCYCDAVNVQQDTARIRQNWATCSVKLISSLVRAYDL